MRGLILTAALAACSNAMAIGQREELFTIELAPGETKVVTEAEKWALRAVGLPAIIGKAPTLEGRMMLSSSHCRKARISSMSPILRISSPPR
jgi:hypothetical protein